MLGSNQKDTFNSSSLSLIEYGVFLFMPTYLVSLWLWGEASCISDVTTFGWRSDWSDIITAGHGRLRRWFAVTHLDILFKKGKQCDNHSFRAKKKYMMYYDFKPGVWQVAIFEFDCLRLAWVRAMIRMRFFLPVRQFLWLKLMMGCALREWLTLPHRTEWKKSLLWSPQLPGENLACLLTHSCWNWKPNVVDRKFGNNNEHSV